MDKTFCNGVFMPNNEGPEIGGPNNTANSAEAPNQEAKANTSGVGGSDKVFDLLGKAMDATDWSWKTKQGDDRELGRLSWNNAKNAWVEAAMEDPKRASEMWRKKTGEAPKADMEKMLAERANNQKDGTSPKGSNGVENLSHDLADLSKRRELSESQTRKTALRASLGEWNIMRGDSQKRREEAKRSRTSQLITPEPNRADDGFHLLKSFYKGYITHHERTQAKIEKHKAKLAAGALREIHKEIGNASATIKKVESDLNVPMAERQSIGLVGKSRQAVSTSRAFRLGTGAATILGKASAKVVEKTAEVAKQVAIQGAVITSNPGSVQGAGNAAYESRMAAFRQFQQSRGVGAP